MAGVQWELTASALERLLARLDPRADRAAEAYEALRVALTRFFDWRGAAFPDECADDALNRLARRLDEGAEVVDIRGFALGIARLVLLERARGPQARQHTLDEHRAEASTAEAEPDAGLHDCLERCLATLPADARRLILEYYQDQRREKIDRRARLAGELGLSANALRSRAQRVRDRLERCVRTCADGPAGDTKPRWPHFPMSAAPRSRVTDDGP
jgi:DNA-directed RNA polymerase specialized sigma24 family protein